MPEAEATPPPGKTESSPAEARLPRAVKELPDGRYLLLYAQRVEPPADR